MSDDILQTILRLNGFEPSERQLSQLTSLIALFQKWNQVINLSSHKTIEDLVEKDVCDAFYFDRLTREAGLTNDALLDLGCGGGLVGLTLSILGKKTITFLDSDRKKINFVREAIRSLKLEGCTCLNVRIEDFEVKNVHFDLIMTRATWNLKEYLNHVQNYAHFARPAVLLGSQQQAAEEIPPLSEKYEIFTLKYNTLPSTYTRCLIISNVKK